MNAKSGSLPASAQAAGRTTSFTIPAMPSARRTGGQVDRTKAPALKLVGYYTKGKTPNWTRVNEYHAWKDHVRRHAPRDLHALRPHDEASRVRVDVVCYFAHGTHGDPENVRKGIVDALFPHGDKWVYGHHDHPRYDAQHPRVEVSVTVFGVTVFGAPEAGRTPSERAASAPEKPPEQQAELHPTKAQRPRTRRAPKEQRARNGGPAPSAGRSGTGGSGKPSKAGKGGAASQKPRTFWAMLKDAFEEAARPTQARAKRGKAPAERAAATKDKAPKAKRRK